MSRWDRYVLRPRVWTKTSISETILHYRALQEYENSTLSFAPLALHTMCLVLMPTNKMVAERKHRHIIEVGLSLLAHASMPLKYWDEAFIVATYLINRLSTKVLNYSTPLEKLFHQK